MAARLSAVGAGRYELGQNSEMNVTPFVDVMLVLLIIFMVAAPLATVSIKLDLPPVNTVTQKPPPTPVYVSLQTSGRIYIGDMETSLERLGADLDLQLRNGHPDGERIYIRADGEVRYEAFMRVMNKLQDNGFYSVALMGEDQGSGS